MVMMMVMMMVMLMVMLMMIGVLSLRAFRPLILPNSRDPIWRKAKQSRQSNADREIAEIIAAFLLPTRRGW